jgi:hypothetical protein
MTIEWLDEDAILEELEDWIITYMIPNHPAHAAFIQPLHAYTHAHYNYIDYSHRIHAKQDQGATR